ncbi:MAG: hypothetical protein QOH86_1298 [Sphingomonadales bacterium]|nr:hypothetical protein [Sphingomonadales bacterium]
MAIAHAQRKHGKPFNDVYQGLLTLCFIKAASLQECKLLHKSLYEGIWTRFGREILRPMKLHEDTVGQKFADFRGVVLGARGNPRRRAVSKPFSGSGAADAGTGKERKSRCDIKEFDRLWQFITCAQGSDTEFTISRFLDGRAFYATALGAQSRTVIEGTGKPLSYLLYEDTLNAWQLGRVIYRVHRAGTARMAAIMHFEELRLANHYLSQIEGRVEDANSALGDASGENTAGENLRDSLRRLYKKVEDQLGKIADLQLDGALEARIERSRYYVRQFAGMARALRIGRVHGFQPYDEFVMQRMGPSFDYVDTVGGKYVRVQTDRSILLNRIQTLDSQYNQEIVSRAQHIADLALSCVLVPYYAGSVISHAVPSRQHFIWITALSFGLIMFFMLRFLGDWGSALAKLGLAKRFVIAFILALVSALIIQMVFGVGEPPPQAHAATAASEVTPSIAAGATDSGRTGREKRALEGPSPAPQGTARLDAGNTAQEARRQRR